MATQLESKNPATGEVIGRVDVTPVDAVPGIVSAARAAGAKWAARSIAERVEVVRRAGAILTARADEIGRLLTREMGKPVREAIGEVRYAASGFGEDLDRMAAALAPEAIEGNGVRSTIYRDAYGVAACIAPWNFPVLMPHTQVVPALVAGNAVVFKPSEETPLTAQAYADALLEVLPPGVLTVIHGDADQGKALVASDVDLIVFTGSQEAGKAILAEASKRLKRVILELGGKDPFIVLDDADVVAAAKFAARNSFRNAGQVCVSTERIYVGPRIRDRFIEELCKAAAQMKVGDGLAEETAIGPLVNEQQRDSVAAKIEEAVRSGARVAWQGEAPKGGAFLPPVVLTGVRPDMSIARRETFGPVACVFDVASEDEAVALANDSPYGLGGIVFGEPDHARRVARRLSSGMVGVNQGLSGAGDTPFVGARESGYGFHSGRDGHRQFAQTRVVHEKIG